MLNSSSTSVDYSCIHANSWLINSNSHFNSVFGSLTDVTRSSYTSAGSKWTVGYTGIVNYDRVFTDDDINLLNSRPKVSSEFSGGKTSAVAGKTYVWGDNIGYVKGCHGYWPPGPVCPSAGSFIKDFTLLPAEEKTTGGCYVNNGPQGYFINGAALFSWADSTSYNGKGIWNNLAPSFEQYDLDVCLGHSAMGTYHHHNYPPCLAERLGDVGDAHSPVYGFANDGFPVHGPWQAKGVLAKSCFAKRDYRASSLTGCSDGKRSCVLVDMFDYTKGSTVASSAGPAENATVTTQSGNIISSNSGIYLEDFYFNATCALDAEGLDRHNGHSHDGLGFHYHTTVDAVGTPVFPFVLGPQFYGCVAGAKCCTTRTTCQATSVCSTTEAVPIAQAQCLSSQNVGVHVHPPPPGGHHSTPLGPLLPPRGPPTPATPPHPDHQHPPPPPRLFNDIELPQSLRRRQQQ